MSYKQGNVFVVEPEAPRKCFVCGEQRECRPYGNGGADICYDCATSSPERSKEMWRQFARRLAGEPDAKS